MESHFAERQREKEKQEREEEMRKKREEEEAAKVRFRLSDMDHSVWRTDNLSAARHPARAAAGQAYPQLGHAAAGQA